MSFMERGKVLRIDVDRDKIIIEERGQDTMTPEQLRDDIYCLLLDIEFQYKGVWGSICPFSRENISVAYGGTEKTLDSVDAVMDEPFIDGKSLNEICNRIQFA